MNITILKIKAFISESKAKKQLNKAMKNADKLLKDLEVLDCYLIMNELERFQLNCTKGIR